MEFSIRSIHQLIRSQGDKRVGEPASKEMRETLEKIAADIAEEAITVANEEVYQTIKKKHIRKAIR